MLHSDIFFLWVSMCVPCYSILLRRRKSTRLLGIPGRPLTIRAGYPPNLPFQRDASWPAAATSAQPQLPSSPGRLDEWIQDVKAEREKMGAASLQHPHQLTEMLNLLSASSSPCPICMQTVRVTHCRLFPLPILSSGVALTCQSTSNKTPFWELLPITTKQSEFLYK